jgi:hypothetical protein
MYHIPLFSLLCYTGIMTIEQTVEIPEPSYHNPIVLQLLQDKQAIMELQIPQDLPAGKAKVEFTVIPQEGESQKPVKSLRAFRGISKGLDTMDAYFERKQADKAKEEANTERQWQEAIRYGREQ